MKKSLYPLLLTGFLPLFANANSIGSDTIFYCKTTAKKQILVELKHQQFIYTYGKNLKQPEITLRKNTNVVDIQRMGFSAGGATLISIPNDDYTYEITSGTRAGEYVGSGDNIRREKEIFAELVVIKNEKTLVTLHCQPQSVYLALDKITFDD